MTQESIEKRAMIRDFRIAYFRRFGNVLSIEESEFKPIANKEEITLYEVERIIMSYIDFNKLPEGLHNVKTFLIPHRSRHLVELRMIYCKILKSLGYKDGVIGAHIGRDRTTVIYNNQQCFILLDTDPGFKDLHDRIYQSIKTHKRFINKNGKTPRIVSKVPSNIKSVNAVTAYKDENKSRKDSSFSKHRSTRLNKTRVPGYRIPIASKSYKDSY